MLYCVQHDPVFRKNFNSGTSLKSVTYTIRFSSVPIILITLLFFNVLCFILFALDKRKARRGQRRISEKTLHLATLPGAAPGAWAAIFLLHHKNRKAAFWGITLLLTLLQGAAVYFLYTTAFSGVGRAA
jgi:uncharacterized membrane protein YsdA (DUF1294 family)